MKAPVGGSLMAQAKSVRDAIELLPPTSRSSGDHVVVLAWQKLASLIAEGAMPHPVIVAHEWLLGKPLVEQSTNETFNDVAVLIAIVFQFLA
jgi:hypothetical protein